MVQGLPSKYKSLSAIASVTGRVAGVALYGIWSKRWRHMKQEQGLLLKPHCMHIWHKIIHEREKKLRQGIVCWEATEIYLLSSWSLWNKQSWSQASLNYGPPSATTPSELQFTVGSWELQEIPSGKMELLALLALTPQLFWITGVVPTLLSEQRWSHCPYTLCEDLSPRVSLVSCFGADNLKELPPMLGSQFKTLMCSFLTTHAIVWEMIWFMCSTES